MSGDLEVTAIIIPKDNSGAAMHHAALCNAAFSQHLRAVVCWRGQWPAGADPPPPYSFSLRSVWMEGCKVHITATLWEHNQDVLADKFKLCGCVLRAGQVRVGAAAHVLLLLLVIEHCCYMQKLTLPVHRHLHWWGDCYRDYEQLRAVGSYSSPIAGPDRLPHYHGSYSPLLNIEQRPDAAQLQPHTAPLENSLRSQALPCKGPGHLPQPPVTAH